MMGRTKRMVTIVAVTALLSLAVPATAQQTGVDQSVSTDSPNPGEVVEVSVEVNATRLGGPALDVDLPDDWAVVSHSDDGGSYNGQQNQWIWISGGVYRPSYEVEVPDSASPGRYVLVAEASGIDPTTGDRVVSSVSTQVRVSADNSSSLNFTYTPEEPGINETVNFEATSDEGGAETYRWSFGDGATATGERVMHTYSERGSHIASLTAVYPDGSEERIQDSIFVGSDDPPRSIPIGRPTATFNYTPETPTPDEVVTFNASESFDEEGGIADYEWDFNDDGEYETTGGVVERSYEQAGNYSVTLRVTDQSGATNTTTVTVGVVTPDEDPSDDGGPLPFGAIAAVVVLLVLGAGAVILREVK